MEIYRIDPSVAAPVRERFAWPLLDLEPGEAFDLPVRLGKTWRDDRIEPSGVKVNYLRVKASNDGIRYDRRFSLRLNREAGVLQVSRLS
jgi:hypothetical protein